MNLDLVLGMSCNNISCLACDVNSGLIAHTASGVLVLLDTDTNCQVRYITLRKNSVSSINFSSDGKLIVTGEIGYRPAVRIWRVKDGNEIAAFDGHEFGIKYVLFSPGMEVIVSVGLEHDNEVIVWSWPEKHKIATNKIVDVIQAVSYSESGSYFVTAGTRHLKFWYPSIKETESALGPVPEVHPLYGRPGILGNNKNHIFIDVCCGNGSSKDLVYTVTKTGDLIILSATDRLIKSHKSIEDSHATCVKVLDQVLFLGFLGGNIHIFNSITLIHLAALPVPGFFCQTDLKEGGVFTMAFNPSNTLLTTAYKNSSMCIWDLQDVVNVKQKYVAVYHSSAIASFDIYTTSEPGEPIRENLVTVSHDSSVHLWGISVSNSICYDRLSILRTDSSPQLPGDEETAISHTGVITAVKVSPDKKYIVTGNKLGNICLYDKDTYTHYLTILAHNREVTCLAFYSDSKGCSVLVSGSRDRLIHVMDGSNNFKLITTLNIHSSSITAIVICEIKGTICMVSCASDRSLSVCTASVQDKVEGINHPPLFQLSKYASVVSSPADIVINLVTEHLAMGCRDGYVRVLDLALLQEKQMFRGCPSEDGQIQKINLDEKGALLITGASDKTINLINFCTGDILISVSGHTKCVTGLTFTSTGDHVISTSMDGCVFIWRLSEMMLMKQKAISLCIKAFKMTDFPEEISYKDIFFLFNKYYSTLAIDTDPMASYSREDISNKEELDEDKHHTGLTKQFENAVKQAMDFDMNVSSNVLPTDPSSCPPQSVVDISVFKRPLQVKKFLSLPSISTDESRSTSFRLDTDEGKAKLLQE
ncbi:mitogen-activated protein kinase-binding protein 1-like [Physella acuta]|uniref:mitogen-activated protein kinase-binding protein 1-like n=1 Tax=Physella acuta TaxID=109671 RepID=UPI0027DD42BF|nr:mitogen-activated protein kinase-binding protein 1-like [Physella acuta]